MKLSLKTIMPIAGLFTLSGCLAATPPDASAFEVFLGKSERMVVARLGTPDSIAKSGNSKTISWSRTETTTSRTPNQIYMNGKWVTTGYTTMRIPVSCRYVVQTENGIVQSHELTGVDRMCDKILPT